MSPNAIDDGAREREDARARRRRMAHDARAIVDAPAWATALMSGLRADALPFLHKKCPPVKDTYKRWFWKQPVPTSSYLIAIVVADLEARLADLAVTKEGFCAAGGVGVHF